ncbi:hypothetical protein CDV36_001460 [Fusarium kuroshium]|uniref:Uncharacterized protein n=2 Tax=Fusarium solani species complex TaxID=232080 RepID=A0A3M2SMR1_9HYPO|nr:hypothetical protein CDV36_001460 [Fusarium kuroshium]RSL86437.1 hypothetical protein CEP51_002797 [Fusarium floridanum]
MFTQILPIHYANGDILRKYLDQKFPGQQYTASMRNNNWTIVVPQRLSQAEIDEVNEEMRLHFYGY